MRRNGPGFIAVRSPPLGHPPAWPGTCYRNQHHYHLSLISISVSLSLPDCTLSTCVVPRCLPRYVPVLYRTYISSCSSSLILSPTHSPILSHPSFSTPSSLLSSNTRASVLLRHRSLGRSPPPITRHPILPAQSCHSHPPKNDSTRGPT